MMKAQREENCSDHTLRAQIQTRSNERETEATVTQEWSEEGLSESDSNGTNSRSLGGCGGGREVEGCVCVYWVTCSIISVSSHFQVRFPSVVSPDQQPLVLWSAIALSICVTHRHFTRVANIINYLYDYIMLPQIRMYHIPS